MTHLDNVAELMAAVASRMMAEPAWLACFKAARPGYVGDSAETAMKAIMDKVTKERVLPQDVCRQIADMFVFGKEVTFSTFVAQYMASLNGRDLQFLPHPTVLHNNPMIGSMTLEHHKVPTLKVFQICFVSKIKTMPKCRALANLASHTPSI